ncbi:HlyD family type I secretion periplasmic adaptor subunit [Paenirhodobacter sp.]|uniref:HlyD family type I secretion periplasmic adaptor subunit n=1 Tax=Paenirhodobacter sp. TaxID=1965326 RepID=UPI003B3F274E
MTGAQHRADAGPETPPCPAGGSLALGYAAVAVLVAGFGGWSVLSSISGAVVAGGQVEVEQSRQVVEHPDGGVVAEILVHDGDLVTAGQPLIRLDGVMPGAELSVTEGQLFEHLARTGRLEAERSGAERVVFPADLLAEPSDGRVSALMAGQDRLFTARLDTLARTLEQLDERSAQTVSQIAGVDAQLAALVEQHRLIGLELTDQRSLLAKGLAQASRVLALEREAASLSGRVGELQALRAQHAGRITEIALERLRLESVRREEAETALRDIGPKVLELTERRRALREQIARLDLRAPVSGIVHAMEVKAPRSVLQPAEPVLYLVPQDRALVVSARIAPGDIDEVTIGQDVTLRLPAFSSRLIPDLSARVTKVSPDVLTEQATGATYYAAEVTLLAGEKEKLADKTLIPGMPVEVYIQTGARSPIAYLLKPITDYFNKAMREG